MITARPIKLRNGSWGARVTGTVTTGDRIQVTAKSGKTWTATVSRVVWSGKDANGELCTIVATAQGKHQSRSSGSHECDCGANEDLLSFGYRPGDRGRCKECGGWWEAY